jgi:hypothetical protein
MSGASTILLFPAGFKRAPPPPLGPEERQTLQALIALAKQDPWKALETDPSLLGPVSPSLAFRLAQTAEEVAQAEPDTKAALALACLSNRAALQCGDPEQPFHSILTFANICLQEGDLDGGKDFLTLLLGLPFADGLAARGKAHLTLATLALAENQWRDAVAHFELGWKIHAPDLAAASRHLLLGKMLDAYRALEDMAGVACVEILLGHTPEQASPLEFFVPDLSLNEILSIVTRIQGLGHVALAERIRGTWQQAKKERSMDEKRIEFAVLVPKDLLTDADWAEAIQQCPPQYRITRESRPAEPEAAASLGFDLQTVGQLAWELIRIVGQDTDVRALMNGTVFLLLGWLLGRKKGRGGSAATILPVRFRDGTVLRLPVDDPSWQEKVKRALEAGKRKP